jgi:hypothetical protein
MKHCHDLIRIRCVVAVLLGIVSLGAFQREWRMAFAQQNTPATRDPTQVQRAQVADGFTLAAAGDLINRFPISHFPEVKPVIAILHAADASVADCESAPVDFTMNHVLSMGAGG